MKNFNLFDDMIADMKPNTNFRAIVNELFIRCRKINVSLVFMTQSCFSVPDFSMPGFSMPD